MKKDDGQRPRLGVVVTLVDLGGGKSRLIMDDVHSDEPSKHSSWKHDGLFTQTQLSSKDIDELALTDEVYALIGSNVMLRLLALNGRVK